MKGRLKHFGLLALLTWVVSFSADAAPPAEVHNESDLTQLVEISAGRDPIGALSIHAKVQTLLIRFRTRCDSYLALPHPTLKQDEAALDELHVILNALQSAYRANFLWMPKSLRLFIFKKINETRVSLNRVSFYVRQPNFSSAPAQKRFYISYLRDRANEASWFTSTLEPVLILMKAAMPR